MGTNTTQKEVLGLENKYWDAMRNNDIETAVSLTKFPAMLSSPKGIQRMPEAEYRKMMKDFNGEQFKGIELQNPQVDVLSEDTVLVSYSIMFNGMKMLDTSTWVKENGKWICAFHTENPLN